MSKETRDPAQETSGNNSAARGDPHSWNSILQRSNGFDLFQVNFEAFLNLQNSFRIKKKIN